MTRSYVLHAGTGNYALRGAETRGPIGSSRTGRQVDVESGRYGDADAWRNIVLRGNASTDDGQYRSLFMNAVREAPLVVDNLVLFRGRNLAPGEQQDFGPPHHSQARAGRYNGRGKPVWYLCSSIEGVAAEVTAQQGRRLAIAEFAIPTSKLRVVDLATNVDSFAHMAFFLAERDDDWNAFGHLLAELVSGEFDGMVVPGVKREPADYFNVVFFDQRPEWKASLVNIVSR